MIRERAIEAAADAESGGSSPSLAPAVVDATARRLGIAAWALAGGIGLYAVMLLTVWPELDTPLSRFATGFALVASVAVALLSRRDLGANGITALGILYEVVLCAGIGLSDFATLPVATGASPHITSACVLIVLIPFVIPGRPRTILLGSLAAAAMLPLAWLACVLFLDRPIEPPSALAGYFTAPVACALVVWVPATVMHRMRIDASRARQLGSYELLERLGEGGMGEVWRAKHRFLARPAAIKLIQPAALGAADAESAEKLVRRFEREAQITASLESPHTIELYDFGVSTGGQLYYVMELLRGMDLQTLVDRFGPLTPERTVHLLLQACDSLADAHARGLVHRDVKPANLFVARKGIRHDVLKVLDFGLVKRWAVDPADPARSEAGTGARTEAGLIIGTPAYLAPEAATGERAVDHRSDLYALGCVAYFMLTGERVFDSSTAMGMAVAHATKMPEPVADRARQPVPDELAAVIMSCLEKEPDARPSSARELAGRLACCGCAVGWSEEQAAAWWSEHLPDLAGSPVAAPDALGDTAPARPRQPGTGSRP